MPLHELKKVQLKERLTLMTQDSIGRLETLLIAFYLWAVAWSLNGNAVAHRSALKKCLAFEFESSLTRVEFTVNNWYDFFFVYEVCST